MVRFLRGATRRPLEPLYPVMFLDALRVNIRDGATVVKKSV
jgi:transposase-like protein